MLKRSFILAAALPLAACFQSDGGDTQQPAQPEPHANAAAATQAPPPLSEQQRQERDRARAETGELRFTVDISDRKLTVRRGDQVVGEHDVAVGDSEHPTPTGSWTIHQVDINPDWNPPDSEWARDREPKEPGDPDNPMGRARLIFEMPYTIHGTDATQSLGTAASHGSIRVSNEVVLDLARMLIRAGGSWDGESWFNGMTSDPRTMHQVRLENPVPIEVVE